MARQPNRTEDDDAKVETLSHTPVEPIPEEAGLMTEAAMSAVREPEFKGDAKALDVEREEVPVKWYRVLADKNITGASGFRARMRAGKEFSNIMFNPQKLRAQGVQFEEISADQRFG
jgi:hypothetical protein